MSPFEQGKVQQWSSACGHRFALVETMKDV